MQVKLPSSLRTMLSAHVCNVGSRQGRASSVQSSATQSLYACLFLHFKSHCCFTERLELVTMYGFNHGLNYLAHWMWSAQTVHSMQWMSRLHCLLLPWAIAGPGLPIGSASSRLHTAWAHPLSRVFALSQIYGWFVNRLGFYPPKNFIVLRQSFDHFQGKVYFVVVEQPLSNSLE